jgi:flagellar biosynthesis protein FlhF
VPAVSQLRVSKENSLESLISLLTDRGIDHEAATTIARFAAPQMNERQRQETDLCRQFLSRTVAGLVQTTGPLWSPGDGQKRIALVGATGVGKTTTIAKLAAEAMTQSGARVALVTIDTYRIAAVEQLKVYGEIMGLAVEVVLSPEQLQEAFRRHRDKDLILIDTAGRSPRDNVRIDELNEFLGQDSGVENCLVLPAPTAERLQQQTLDAFSRLPLSRLIFTKLDESDRCGSIINLSTRSNLPLAYLTNGQQVPEDLLLAEPQAVADLVMAPKDEERRVAV